MVKHLALAATASHVTFSKLSLVISSPRISLYSSGSTLGKVSLNQNFTEFCLALSRASGRAPSQVMGYAEMRFSRNTPHLYCLL